MNKQTKQQFIRQGERGDFNALAKVLDETANPASPVPLPSFAVAGLPAASAWAGHIAYSPDGAGGNPCLVVSNGTNWLRCDTLATAAGE